MEAAKVIMEAEASSLMTLDPETEELIITVSTGAGSEEAPGFRIPKGEGVSGWVVENEKPLVLQDAQKDPRFFGDVAEGFKTKSLICVPLKSSKGEIMGVLEAINKKDGTTFKESDVPIFSALADQAAISLEKAQLYQESLEKKLLEQQLDMARKVQEQFLPKEIPIYEGIELSGMSLPAAHVGGDYYDFIPIDDKKCAIVIADICGKGIPAGLLMSTLRAALRTQVEGKHSIKETLNLVNNIIFKDTTSDKFVTLFFGIIDAETREFTYTNAGHNPPYIFDQTENKLETLTEGGPVLGVFKDFDYPSQKIKLHPGQFIVMFTDGVTEAMDKKEEYFDESRLENIILECGNISANALMQKIYSEVKKHSQDVAQYDDITLLIVKTIN
jgi:sigma-B regulation protein RsbU (phosphoserine phosphatase)